MADNQAATEPVNASRWERLAPRALSTLASFVLHVVALLILATCVAIDRYPSAGLSIFVANPSVSEGMDLEDSGELESELETVDFPITPSAPATDLALSVNPQFLSDEGTAASGVLAGALASAASGNGSGRSGAEALGEALSKEGAKFFGAYAQGERFVFVLDSSRSMSGARWLYACEELLASIRELEPHHKFFVICFDVGPKPMFNMPMARARYYNNDQATMKRLEYWLKSVQLGPATQPSSSLLKALDMHPDAVFLLSDGELQDDTIVALRRANGFSSSKPQVPIHAIHLMSLDGRSTLQLIARENSGTFTPIVE